jgi:hypothetical protein
MRFLFSSVNKSLIVALAFSLGSFAATSWSFFFAMKKESRRQDVNEYFVVKPNIIEFN